jgi:EmrB/QacA subfamily drug resistance transporter
MTATATTSERPGGPVVETPAPRRRLVFGALLLVLFIASLDQTIVSTALPTIVGDLGGLQHLSWVVTAYLLASTVVGPVYGKLGDLYGRKRVLQAALVLFLAGSALCGLAGSMFQLIVFRAVQGLGGGGLIVVSMAAVGDIVSPRERGRYQGLFGGVLGVSVVAGPLLGGFFVDNLSWRWIFYINLPFGLVALAVISSAFRSRQVTERHRIDWLGTLVLAAGLSGIILYTSLGGTSYAWSAPWMLAAISGGVALLALFPFVEARTAEPILPLELFRNATFRTTSGIGLVIGFALFGSVTFIPLYLQIVKGHSATGSGLLMTPMMLGVLVTSTASGFLISRYGSYRRFPRAGTALAMVALYLLSTLEVTTSTRVASAYMLLLGFGLGLVMQVLVLATQNAVDYRLLGVATSGATLFRQIGGSIGVSAFGAIFTNRLGQELAHRLPAGAHAPAHASPAAIQHLPAEIHAVYTAAVAAALHPVYLTAAAIMLGAFALSWTLRDVPLRETAQPPVESRGETFAEPGQDTPQREREREREQVASSLVSGTRRSPFHRRALAAARRSN